MQEEDDKSTDAPEGEAKPTITIAERDSDAAATAAGKPTITIAEREADDN